MRVVSRLLGLSLALVMSMGVPPLAAAEPAKEFDAVAYAAVLTKARAGDPTTDYNLLRTQSLFKVHRMETRWAQEKEAFESLNANPAQALHLAEDGLSSDYVELFAHVVAEKALTKLGRTDEAKIHHANVVGLLRSITGGLDGLSKQTAFNANSVHEEYETLAFIGLRPSGPQSLLQSDGHMFDTLVTTEPKSGKQLTVWFNIDSYFGHELGQ